MSQTVTAPPTDAEVVESPVTTIFTFGFGHVDPNSGEKLADSCAIVTASDYEACRQLMCKHFGTMWAFDYYSWADALTPGFRLRIHAVVDTSGIIYPAASFSPVGAPAASQWGACPKARVAA